MEINGKVYRNLPQQVLKNQEDILALKSQTVDSYTKAESDAKFETKEAHQSDFNALSSETDTLNQQMATANTDINNLKKVSETQATAISTLKADVERIDPIVPTDIAVHEGKLGLEHDTVWLTNQSAITLGDGLTYDEATKTLKAKGGNDNTLTIIDYPTNGQLTDEQFNMIKANPGKYAIRKKTGSGRDELFIISADFFPSYSIVYEDDSIVVQGQTAAVAKHLLKLRESDKTLNFSVDNQTIVSSYQKLPNKPSDASTSTYILKLINGKSTWVAGGASEHPTYNHFVKLSGTDGTYEGELYITITSTNGNVINNLTDFDTVMTNFVGTVECSGYYTENLNDGYPIIRLMWERNFS